MDKKTPNKRKSLSNAKETPNKIRKTITPVSQKINNKSPKSTNTKQKTPQTQKNNKTITHKGKKLTKQIEEDETDDESDELNGTNDNDAVNSDNEVEASSDEDAENGEADSGEEAASDDEAEIDETNSDENVLERNTKDSSGGIKTGTNFSIYVKGFKKSSKLEDVFKDCNIFRFRIEKDPVTNKQNGQAFVTFTDKESLTKALKLDGTRYEGRVLSVVPYIEPETEEFQIYVKNLSENTKVEDVFKDCKIKHSILLNPDTQAHFRRTVVGFEDEETLQKALLHHKTEHDGRVISVFRNNCSVRVNVNVDSKLKDLFKDCNIQGMELQYGRIKEYHAQALVNFKDKESLQKALAKHNTEIDGTTISVELYGIKRTSRNSRDSGFNPPRKYGNSGQFKPSPRESYNPGSKIAFLKKQLLLEELKLETQKLEREIYKQSKPFNHRKQFQK